MDNLLSAEFLVNTWNASTLQKSHVVTAGAQEWAYTN